MAFKHPVTGNILPFSKEIFHKHFDKNWKIYFIIIRFYYGSIQSHFVSNFNFSKVTFINFPLAKQQKMYWINIADLVWRKEVHRFRVKSWHIIGGISDPLPWLNSFSNSESHCLVWFTPGFILAALTLSRMTGPGPIGLGLIQTNLH